MKFQSIFFLALGIILASLVATLEAHHEGESDGHSTLGHRMCPNKAEPTAVSDDGPDYEAMEDRDDEMGDTGDEIERYVDGSLLVPKSLIDYLES